MINLKNIYIYGDVNSQTNLFMIKIRLREIRNSHIIILSNFGIGVNKIIKTEKLLIKLNNELILRNIILYLNKGNMDNSKQFKNYKSKFSNIKFISNYDIVTINHKNFLFLNNLVPLNRSYNYNPKRTKITTFLKSDIKSKLSVNYVISNELPTFISPYNMNNIKPFSKSDKWLYNDVKKNRINMDKVYNNIIESNGHIIKWFNSTYDKNLIETKDNTDFVKIKKLKLIKL